MKKSLIVLLTLTVALGGCGRVRESRLNPFNWFGGGARAEAPVAPTAAVSADKRALVAQVTGVTFDRYPGGTIIRATGLPPSQGWWDAELVARPVDENGVLVYDFRVFPPDAGAGTGPAQSREITVAVAISDIKMEPIRRIVVQGAGNALGANR